jgi:hypothetical protein
MKINQLTQTILFLFFIGFSTLSIAQESKYSLLYPEEVKDSTVTYQKAWKSPEKFLQVVLNNEFSRLITGNTLAGIGNYASINTANSTLDASINSVKNHRIYSFKFKAGLNDNIATIFNNNRLSSNITIGITYHSLLFNDEESNILPDYGDILSINNGTKKLAEAHTKKYNDIVDFKVKTQASILKKKKELKDVTNKKKLLNNIVSRKQDIEEQIDKLKTSNKTLSKQVKEREEKIKEEIEAERGSISQRQERQLRITVLFEDIRNLKDSIQHIKANISAKDKKLTELKDQELQKSHLLQLYNTKIKNLNKEIVKLEDKFKKHNEGNEIDESRNKTILVLREHMEKINSIRALDVSIQWWSFGFEGTYQTFNLFDSTLPVNNQIFQENDWVPSFFIAFSGYTNGLLVGKSKRKSDLDLSPKHIKYYSFGYKGTYGNNLSSLDLVEVKTTDEISSERELIKRVNAYVGNFEEQELSGQIFGEYYQFTGSKNNVGFHIKGTLDVGSFRPVASTRIGILIPFVDSKNLKSSVNLEVFFGLNDLFNKASDKSLFARNVFGVQASLPLNFNLIK